MNLPFARRHNLTLVQGHIDLYADDKLDVIQSIKFVLQTLLEKRENAGNRQVFKMSFLQGCHSVERCSLPNQPLVSTTHSKRTFENIVGKREKIWLSPFFLLFFPTLFSQRLFFKGVHYDWSASVRIMDRLSTG